ncbi:MAG: hypothetical protein KF873_22580 [Gemmataceae bacterium]|nr:hypothetical protein [Planctomycetia bacterium]MBX3401530.1 hypothetical protein [Gemmataceae bacterium]
MKRWLLILAPLAFAGCGGGSPAMNTRAMSNEEIRQMKEDDKRIEDEERSGAGTAVAKPKRKK